MSLGLAYVLVAGIFQGIFLLPMDRVRGWRWEEGWLAFSIFGMLVFNWSFTFITIPGILDIYRAATTNDLERLLLFGLGWGAGAVLFGLGMARLGLALGYPIIMGLIASLGALVPLILILPRELLTAKGGLIVIGTLVVMVGIAICSRAAELNMKSAKASRSGLAASLAIAIAAGGLSSLPNIGMTFATRVISIAEGHGVSTALAGNAIWALFFTAGFLVNAGYCVYRIQMTHSAAAKTIPLFNNLLWTALMGLLWICSFYAYGMGAARLGSLGPVIGWPLFITSSICVGNLLGLMRGEWKNSPGVARRLLFGGLLVLIAAVALIATSATMA